MLAYVCWEKWQRTPVNPGVDKVTIEIHPGASGAAIGDLLVENGIMPSTYHFVMLCKYKGALNQLKAGYYELSGNETPLEILDAIRTGRIYTWNLIIPEGFNVKEIDARLSSWQSYPAGSFIEAASETLLLDKFHIPAKSAEGYFFPSTYKFSKDTPPAQIALTMIKTFVERLPSGFDESAQLVGLTRHEAVILASIIEKETGAIEERPLISAVFHNRLKRKMRLQTDPTVIYAIENFDGNLRKKDLEINSPYNTYKYPGLPVGPICNPGEAALMAAVKPAAVNYLYFVSKGDGSHLFSSNLVEHNQAVAKYQKRSKNSR